MWLNFKKYIKENYSFILIYFALMLMVLLIATTSFFYFSNYTLHLPGNDIFANITFGVVLIYGILLFFIIQFFHKKKIGIEYLYLVLAIPLGIMYCIANPLGKIPDESQHARKAYMVSKGVFFAEKDENGYPVGMLHTKINEAITSSNTSYEEFWNRLCAEETGEEIKENYSMATYAPICHMPQAFGMFITRLFGAGLSVQAYAARIVNLAVSITLLFFAIKKIPFKKNIVLFLALLPITLSECASMSSDALAISSCIFYIAYILYLKYDNNKNKISKKDVAILAISSSVVALCKIVYLPLCLLLFLLPKEKFASKKSKIIITSIIFTISVVLNLLWLGFASTFLVEVNPGVDSAAQVKYILTNPIAYCLILFRTIHIYNQTFILCLCGEGLGAFNAQASVLFTLPCMVIFALLFFACDDEKKESFDLITKVIFGIVFAAIVLLVYTSLYVAWTPLKSAIILGVQSRYFLPVLLLTAIVFDNKKLILKVKEKEKYITAFLIFLNLNALSCLSYTYIFKYIIEYYIK